MLYLQNVHIISIVAAIVAVILALTVSAARRKSVLIYPVLIIGAILAFTLFNLIYYQNPEELIILFFLFPVIAFCLLFLLAYYLKALYCYLKPQDVKKKIMVWTGVISLLAVLVFLCALPFINSTAYKNEMNTEKYQNHPLFSEVLKDYYPSAKASAYDGTNTVEFDSVTIPLPFDAAGKEVVTKEGLLLFMEGQKPVLAIFDNRISTGQIPAMAVDMSTDTAFNRAVGFTYKDMGYIKQKEYLNTVPRVNRKGVPNNYDMNSPAMMYKQELLLGFAPTAEEADDLKIRHVAFNDPAINGLLYQGASFQFVEVYKNDAFLFTIFIFSPDPNAGYLDYILTNLFF